MLRRSRYICIITGVPRWPPCGLPGPRTLSRPDKPALAAALGDIGLLCWQRQWWFPGCHGLNGSSQPRHTADLASISLPNGLS